MATDGMVAWANLVGAIVQTLKEAEAPNSFIHQLLDNLDEANASALSDRGQEFALDITGVFRLMVPGNDR